MLCNRLGMLMHYHKIECCAEIGVLPNRVGSPSILIKLCDLALLSETFMVLKAPALPASVSHGNSRGDQNFCRMVSPKCHPAWLWNNALKVVTNHFSKQNTSVANKSWYLYHRFYLSFFAHTQCRKCTLEVVFLSENDSQRPLKKINFDTTCRLILNDYDQISTQITKVATISLFTHVTRVPARQCFSLQNWVCVE